MTTSGKRLRLATAGAGGGTESLGPADSYFKNVALLVNSNDITNGAQNKTFTDSSSQALTFTPGGTPATGSFTPFNASTWSFYCPASTGSTLSNPAGLVTAFAGWGGRTRTFECWIYRGNSGDVLFQAAYDAVAANGRWHLSITSNKLHIQWTTGTGSETGVSGTINVPVGQWSHVAIGVNSTTSSNTTVYFAVDGVVESSTGNNFSTQTSTYGWKNMFQWTNYAPSSPTDCYFHSIRWSSNIRYSSNYSVPTTDFTTDGNTLYLTAQKRYFKEESNNYTITPADYTTMILPFGPWVNTTPYSPTTHGGSGYFNGSTDYVRADNVASAVSFGSGDVTIEFWAYMLDANDGHISSSGQGAAGYNHNFTCYTSSSGQTINLGWNQGNGGPTASAATNRGCWNHIAFVRNNAANNIVTYVNGVGTTTSSVVGANNDVGYDYDIGHYFMDNGYLAYWKGWIMDYRQVVGTAVYTGNFTPPIAPLATSGAASAASYSSTTNVNTSFAASNCKILMKFQGAGVIDASGHHNLVTVSNAQVSTTSKKYGTGSLKFNGTSDYLTAYTQPLGSGKWTVEFWVKINAIGAAQAIVDLRTHDSQNYSIDFCIDSSGHLVSTTPNFGYVTGSTALSAGVWYHVAFVQDLTNVKVYVNGVLDGTGSGATTITEYILRIGYGTNGYFGGYIDDLRITRNVARYTGNFTPPSRSLPTYGS